MKTPSLFVLLLSASTLAACGGTSGTDRDVQADAGIAVDSGTDAGGNADGGNTPAFDVNTVRFTYKNFTSTVNCAKANFPSAYFKNTVYHLECAVGNDESGSGSVTASFKITIFDPAVRTLTAEDFGRYGMGGFNVLASRLLGNAPGSLMTVAGYGESAQSMSNVKAAITAYDAATGHLAADFSLSAVDKAGEAWTLEGRFDKVFVAK
jgi:predicted small secreted protein